VNANEGDSTGLVPVETFDPCAFVPDENHSPALCAFVLTLAAIYNDFKNIMLADHLLEKQRPPGSPAETAAWGEYNGFRSYLVRVLAGLFHELLGVVSRNKSVLSDRAFTEAVKHIPKSSRESWQAIADAAFTQPSQSDVTRSLLLARNKVIFHYDCKEILKGYNLRFADPNQPSAPYISRGNTMQSTRFHFADAAAQAYLRQCLETQDIHKEYGPASPLITQVNLALHEIVLTFIQRRGCPWRSVPLRT